MTCHLIQYNIQNKTLIIIIMKEEGSEIYRGTHKERKRCKDKDSSHDTDEVKTTTKKTIRKEKNRLAAQKSRDRRQEYIEGIEKEISELRSIIDRCPHCTQAFLLNSGSHPHN